MQLHPTNLAIIQPLPGRKYMGTSNLTSSILGHNHKLFDVCLCWSVKAPFLGGIREPRGCNWPFPSHNSMRYHFHSSIYHWRESERGHFVCVVSTSHHHWDYMSPKWMLVQISTLKLIYKGRVKDVIFECDSKSWKSWRLHSGKGSAYIVYSQPLIIGEKQNAESNFMW